MKEILLHGLGQSASSWRGTIEAMGAGFDVFCPSFSQWLEKKAPTYATLYQALERCCEKIDQPLNLCGLSLGGMLALQYGIQHPEKVHALVLIGTQFRAPKGLLQLQNLLFRLMPAASFQKMGFGKEEVMRLSRSMMDLDFAQELKTIQCPVLILCGEKDGANRAAALQLKERIPRAEFSLIAKAGHEVNVDNPMELGKRLSAFFREKSGFAG